MSETCIELDDVSLRFGLTLALDKVSSQVPVGEIVGLIGRNGAGKTTLLQMLAGLIRADSGASRLLGHDCLALPDRVRQELGVVFQDDELFEWMRVARHIEAVGAHYKNWDPAQARDLTERWSIPLHKRVSDLSRGQRQKLAILLAIVHRPSILLLDEPASSLDPVSRREFLAELIDLACDGSRTVVLSSHLLGDVERLASRIWMMRSGQLVLDEPLDELKDDLIRLQYRGDDTKEFPEIPATISRFQDGCGLTIVARQPGSAVIESLQQEFGAKLRLTPMNLEQMALELL